MASKKKISVRSLIQVSEIGTGRLVRKMQILTKPEDEHPLDVKCAWWWVKRMEVEGHTFLW